MSCHPRVLPIARVLIGAVLAVAFLNGLAALAYAPSARAGALGERVADSRLDPLIAGGLWAAALALVLVVIACGVQRRRRGAWLLSVGLLGGLAAHQLVERGGALQIALPLAAAATVLALRRSLVAEPYRQLLAEHMVPTEEAIARTADLVRRYGRDALQPFQCRPDVGHLFARRGEAGLTFRVENRCLLVGGGPVGDAEGRADVMLLARDLARAAGLRFGVSSASEALKDDLERDLGMRGIYMGCEAVVATETFSLDGHRIKKVRQAHRRVQREGYELRCLPAADLTPAEREAIHALEASTHEAAVQSTFAMAPPAFLCDALSGAQVLLAQHRDTGQLAGAMAFVPLAQRSMWSLAVQLRDPSTPNGIIDALVVHALQSAREQQVAAVSLNFAAARRYLHEPATGFWLRVAAVLARLATRWTQIDELRYHNEKFSPSWEPRYLVVDHELQLPHLAFATIWQEGQLPRPTGLIRSTWPACGESPQHARA